MSDDLAIREQILRCARPLVGFVRFKDGEMFAPLRFVQNVPVALSDTQFIAFVCEQACGGRGLEQVFLEGAGGESLVAKLGWKQALYESLRPSLSPQCGDLAFFHCGDLEPQKQWQLMLVGKPKTSVLGACCVRGEVSGVP
ncbi:MAG: hypothetical protein U0165_17430 [Polyangiaceae bacterium]